VEKRAFRVSGFLMFFVLVVWICGVGIVFRQFGGANAGLLFALTAIVGTIGFILLVTGFTTINPNEARVIQFFGQYVGTIDRAGFHWTWSLSTKRKVSLRVRNFETARLKVSDADGNPVEIAAVIVWRVVDTAKATFGVNDHVAYVVVQAEAGVRHLATSYPYEAHDSGRPSLRDSEVVSGALTEELRERVTLAGVEVLETRVTHLAYAPEIAQAMLARQQASAIVAARFKIVEGAVGMVQQALASLRENDVVELDEERKAQMVANLLVVLCGDRAAQPVVNTGTLY